MLGHERFIIIPWFSLCVIIYQYCNFNADLAYIYKRQVKQSTNINLIIKCAIYDFNYINMVVNSMAYDDL